jgi:hypothetical protein
MLRALLTERRAQFAAGVGGAIEIAKLYVLLGDTPQARQFMTLAVKRKEPGVAYLALRPDLQRLAGGAPRQGG